MENFDVLILSGGVSMGKKDFIPDALAALGVKKLFHKIAQRPGKPFWFGRKDEKLVFALPGNPVSTFVCTLRYVLAWLRQSVNLKPLNFEYAKLNENVIFKPNLTFFLQVKTVIDESGIQWATPVKGNGSGDFVNLIQANGFIELPNDDCVHFKRGDVFKVWKY